MPQAEAPEPTSLPADLVADESTRHAPISMLGSLDSGEAEVAFVVDGSLVTALVCGDEETFEQLGGWFVGTVQDASFAITMGDLELVGQYDELSARGLLNRDGVDMPWKATRVDVGLPVGLQLQTEEGYIEGTIRSFDGSTRGIHYDLDTDQIRYIAAPTTRDETVPLRTPVVPDAGIRDLLSLVSLAGVAEPAELLPTAVTSQAQVVSLETRLPTLTASPAPGTYTGGTEITLMLPVLSAADWTDVHVWYNVNRDAAPKPYDSELGQLWTGGPLLLDQDELRLQARVEARYRPNGQVVLGPTLDVTFRRE